MAYQEITGGGASFSSQKQKMNEMIDEISTTLVITPIVIGGGDTFSLWNGTLDTWFKVALLDKEGDLLSAITLEGGNTFEIYVPAMRSMFTALYA